jgi:AcrR family transcriptional regulator
MSPKQRREMLVAATLPLVARHGLKVTTRQIAEAAGVAEGTIFRVFPDKDALIRAAVSEALDPEPVFAELAEVDMRLEVHDRMVAVTGILQRRIVKVFNLLIAVGMHQPLKDIDEHRARARPQQAAILKTIERILEPDGERFRRPVSEVARILHLLTFSGSHPLISDGRMLTTEEITDVVLHGTLHHHHESHHHESHHHESHHESHHECDHEPG